MLVIKNTIADALLIEQASSVPWTLLYMYPKIILLTSTQDHPSMYLSTHSLLDLHPIPVLLVGSVHTLQIRATLIGLLQ